MLPHASNNTLCIFLNDESAGEVGKGLDYGRRPLVRLPLPPWFPTSVRPPLRSDTPPQPWMKNDFLEPSGAKSFRPAKRKNYSRTSGGGQRSKFNRNDKKYKERDIKNNFENSKENSAVLT